METSIFALTIICFEVHFLLSSLGKVFGGLRLLDKSPSLFGLRHGKRYLLVII